MNNKFDLHNREGEYYAEVRMPGEHYKKLMDTVQEMVRSANALLNNHEDCHGTCEDCLADGRGTHAEQLQTALDKWEKLK